MDVEKYQFDDMCYIEWCCFSQGKSSVLNLDIGINRPFHDATIALCHFKDKYSLGIQQHLVPSHDL